MALIYQPPTEIPGLEGVLPNPKYMVVGDTLAALTTAGYMSNVSSESFPLAPNDVLHILYNYNQQTNVGTFGVFYVTMANGVVTLNQSALAPSIYLGTNTVNLTLNQADVLGMYAAPVQLVAAPGAGLVLNVIEASIYTNFQTAAFATGGVAVLQYDSTVHGAGTNALSATIPAAEITAAASQVYNLGGAVGTALTGITNKGLYLSNQTAAFTAGNAASTVVVTLVYNILTATV